MSVIEATADAHIEQRETHEVVVDLLSLRDWGSSAGCTQAARELRRIRHSLEMEGIPSRSAARFSAALARFAFLTADGCAHSRRVLWRLHAVDGVPADVLAGLRWPHVRPRLREIAFPDHSGTRYFALSSESCRLLNVLRGSAPDNESVPLVFSQDRDQPWQPGLLAVALSCISSR